jgi:hypothetical protein
MLILYFIVDVFEQLVNDYATSASTTSNFVARPNATVRVRAGVAHFSILFFIRQKLFLLIFE